jgi:hypothetical protein
MPKANLGRRRFLLGAGGAALALPFLPSLTRGVRAAPMRFPRRFIAVFTANGQYDGNWYPTQSLEFKQVAPGIREIPLTDIPGSLSVVLGPEFDPFRKKMLLIRGLDNAVLHENTHIATKMMSGYGEAAPLRPTIDQIIARSPSMYATEPWLRTLNVVADGQSEMKHLPLSVARNGNLVSPVVPYTDPSVVFQKLFPTPIDHDVKKSIIDSVAGEMQRLSSSPRLSSDDRQRLDAHLSFLRDVERQTMPANSCARPGLLTVPDLEEKSAAEIIRNYATLIVSSIKCDLCRVFGLQLNHTQEQRSFAWLTGVSGTNHHNLTHESKPGVLPPLATINRWYSALVAEFLTQLDVVEDPETGATYLDNSLVFWGNESGVYDITHGNPHYSNDMQVLLAGGKGLIKTDRFLNYQTPGKKIIMSEDGRVDQDGPDFGRPYNELLISLMMKMGLTHEEWETGQEPGFGDYRVNFKGQYNFGDRRSPLPNL